MSALTEIYIKTETLETLANTAKKKGVKGISITISINDESNEWGQNLSGYISQSKEEREINKPKFYVGNGKVFWNNGKITNGVKNETGNKTEKPISDDEDDLPF